MLAHLQRRAENAIAGVDRVLLCTFGPAEIQAGEFECKASGLRVYLRVPLSSDHLFNLETHPEVVVSAKGWQIRGKARVTSPQEAPANFALEDDDQSRWFALVQVRPDRLQLMDAFGNIEETIDVTEALPARETTQEKLLPNLQDKPDGE
jgi:hypothetical protein